MPRRQNSSEPACRCYAAFVSKLLVLVALAACADEPGATSGFGTVTLGSSQEVDANGQQPVNVGAQYFEGMRCGLAQRIGACGSLQCNDWDNPQVSAGTIT